MSAVIDSSISHWQTCIDACMKCMQSCEECLTSCLKEPDASARVDCINMLRDCTDICALASRWMARGSMHAKQICQLCATICDACAEHCNKYQDHHCKECADMCKQCADECRRMSA